MLSNVDTYGCQYYATKKEVMAEFPPAQVIRLVALQLADLMVACSIPVRERQQCWGGKHC